MERPQLDLYVDKFAGDRDRLDVKAERTPGQFSGGVYPLGRNIQYFLDRLAAQIREHGVREI
jgi:hypothetical protein